MAKKKVAQADARNAHELAVKELGVTSAFISGFKNLDEVGDIEGEQPGLNDIQVLITRLQRIARQPTYKHFFEGYLMWELGQINQEIGKAVSRINFLIEKSKEIEALKRDPGKPRHLRLVS